VQELGLLSKNVARISHADNAPAGTLDTVAMEMDVATGALFIKKDKLGFANGKPAVSR
jgi:hypothetical protein